MLPCRRLVRPAADDDFVRYPALVSFHYCQKFNFSIDFQAFNRLSSFLIGNDCLTLKSLPNLKYLYCNKIAWHCIIISHWKLLHSNIVMLSFTKRYRTLSSISKISLCFQVWLYALKLLLFSNLQDSFFFSTIEE